jgi:aminoglycoside phosphotransferase (APT) family kinase protein
MVRLSLHTTQFQQLLRRVRRPLVQLVEQRALDRYVPLVGRLLAQLAHELPGQFPQGAPAIVRGIRTRSDVAVFLLGERPANQVSVVLKLPLSRDAERSTELHRQVVATLHERAELHEFCRLVPRALAWGTFEGQAYYLETALDGVAASDLLRQQAAPAQLKQAASAAIGQLHRGTLQRVQVDDTLFATIAGNDLAALARMAEGWPEPALLRSRVQALEALLRQEIFGRELPFAWGHGDYWPGNILVRPSDGALAGIVDWDRAAPLQLPLLDIFHLLAFTRQMQQRSEVGEEIVGYLLPAQYDPTERALIDQELSALCLPESPAFLRAATLLYWLRFAAANLARYPAFQHDDRWLSKNVFIVLKRGL